MTEHDHRTFVEGCYRCDLSRDEVEKVLIDSANKLADERDRYRAALENAEDEITRHYLDTSVGAQILGILTAALDGTKGQD